LSNFFDTEEALYGFKGFSIVIVVSCIICYFCLTSILLPNQGFTFNLSIPKLGIGRLIHFGL